MPGLVLEGGACRGLFTDGVLDALLTHEVYFPYCIGVSAGISSGYSYISRQFGRNWEIIRQYRNDKRYLSWRNMLKCRSVFGLDFVFREIPERLIPFDYETFYAYEGKALVGVTNAHTGEIEYYDKDGPDLMTLLVASCAMPGFFPMTRYNGSCYYDGGIADPIPVQKSMTDGNQKNLVVLTQPLGYRKGPEKKQQYYSLLLKRKYPRLVDTIQKRSGVYNAQLDLCAELEAKGEAVVLRPTYETNVDRFEGDLDKLFTLYRYGYDLTSSRIEEIKALFV